MSSATDQGGRPRGLDRHRLVALASALPVPFALLLLVPAGTRAWGQGWLFVLNFRLSAIAAFL